MTYDSWKLRSPDDEFYLRSPDDGDEEPEQECAHEEYERDILTGRATCENCGHRWYMTDEQVAADVRREREYDEWQRRENRRQFWRSLTYPIRWPVYRLLERIWPRKSCAVLTDDEIPF